MPALLVPDNLKSAIKQACRYEPEATSTYADLARHYATAILPARPFHPRDKAPVEASVLLAQRWILARLRNRQFFSLAELNAAIGTLLVDLNQRPFKKLEGCRASAFATIDRPAMRPLPQRATSSPSGRRPSSTSTTTSRSPATTTACRTSLVRQKVEVRFTATTVECFFKGKRVAAHARSNARGRHTTLPEHMPESHRKHQQWTPGRLLNWALSIGPGTRDVVRWQLENRPHPEQGYRACLGLLNLASHYGEPGWKRLACGRWRSARPPASASSRSSRPSSINTRSCSRRTPPMPQRQPPGSTRQCARARVLPFHHH